MEKSTQLSNYLKNHKLLCDGAFGTYYASKYETDELPEYANTIYPDRVKCIHEEYLKAGAQLIRTNTFAVNHSLFEAEFDIKSSIKNAYEIATQIANAYNTNEKPRFVAADIGPISCETVMEKKDIQDEYCFLVNEFLELGASIFVFETFTNFEDIKPAIERIGNKAFIIVQFAVNQFGYSSAGLSAAHLFTAAHDCDGVDAIGLNCGVGPGHMLQLLSHAIRFTDKYTTALPNAGYPQIISNRMIFSDKNINYFVEKELEIASQGISIIGGCCGTTPEYIRVIAEKLDTVTVHPMNALAHEDSTKKIKIDDSFYFGKENKKIIAVELAPPLGGNDEVLMDAAHMLKSLDVDVVTFPDSPSGRTRADSILMAEKVSRETGLCVMPHICCRDKNAIAMRSQLLGAYINKINNFLVITGDPIPSVMRNSVESVFSFDAVGLMNIIKDMNQEIFNDSFITYGGAINQGRRNFDVEISRVKKKMDAGATFFMTQPVFSEQDIMRLKQLKKETGAKILYGIMPFVSLKNALFMKNEMSGINVTDDVLNRYHGNMTKEEGEQAGIELAIEMIERTKEDADGYYFSFPFNRVHMLKSIMKVID